MHRIACSLSSVIVLAAFLGAAETAFHPCGTKADYERAANLGRTFQGKTFKTAIRPHWLADGHRFWYRNDLTGNTREFVLVDAATGTRMPAFDHARLAAAFEKSLGRKVEATRLPVERVEFLANEDAVDLWAVGAWWRCPLQSYELRRLDPNERPAPTLEAFPVPRHSQGKGGETQIAFINRTKVEVDLQWIDFQGQRKSYGTLAPGASRVQNTFAGHVWAAIAKDGRMLAAFEATEEPAQALIVEPKPEEPPTDRAGPRKASGTPSPDGRWSAFLRNHNIFIRNAESGEELALTNDGSVRNRYHGELLWSPNSRHLLALQTEAGQERKVHAVESSPQDRVEPRLHTWDYLKPGDRIEHRRPCLFDMTVRQRVAISEDLFPNPWSIGELRWVPDGQHFTFLYNQRGHQVLRLVAVSAETGAARALIEEAPPTFVDYSNKVFCHPLDRTGEILWMSERNGWNHLYLFDAKTGTLKNPVTQGEWVVRGVDRVDEEKRQVWFHAGGIRAGQDPYYLHYARVNLDGSGLTILTEGDGTHRVACSPDGRFLIDTWSRVDQPPVIELRRADDGKRICELERADASALVAAGWRPPERFVAKGRDGTTDIHGVIHRPMRFDPQRKYPVIECIYAGPHGYFVPKEFSALHGAQELAELGFIVVQIDGMGTNWRSRAFHDVAWKNLGDSGFPDRCIATS